MGVFDGILLMSDLDGTLLDSQKLVSVENARAIARFQRGGGRFTFATGRSLPATAHLIDGFALNAPAVLSNGCHGYDFSRGQTVFEWPIGQNAREVCRAILAHSPLCGVEIHTSRGVFVAQDSEYTRRHFENTKMPLVFAAPHEVELPWVKLCVTAAPELMPDIMRFIAAAFPNEHFLQLAAPHFLEVQAKNTDKGAGALEICRVLQLSPEKLFAVGDGPNDVELLGAAKYAFAPANACAEILALGPRMLPANEQSCIAALIDIIEREYI